MSPKLAPRNAPRIACSTPSGGCPPASVDPLQGTAYRTVRWVARGGMGEVVEAEHLRLGKRVMVKLLTDRHGPRRDLDERLRLEAQTLARLDHPNLVAVHDLGRTASGRAYLVMERLEGCTLGAELRRRGALPWLEAVDIACQVLDALAVAHGAGVVHRDVKLDNVFLCAAHAGRRRVKLLDFGIAKVLSPAPLGLEPMAFRTDESVAVGTPRCFSPEQALGNRVDERSDVYGAGVLLYSLLAGRGPFDELLDTGALVRAHATRAAPPPSRWAGSTLPRELEHAVLRALAKQPAHRPPSAAAFAQALRDMAAAHRAPLPPPAAPRPTTAHHPAGRRAQAPGWQPARGSRAPIAARPTRAAILICVVILTASATASTLLRLGGARERDFLERLRTVVSMDLRASEAREKGGTR